MLTCSNVGSCCAFTEAFPSPALRAYSIDYLFRNLDTALASGMCNDLSERTWCGLLTLPFLLAALAYGC